MADLADYMDKRYLVVISIIGILFVGGVVQLFSGLSGSASQASKDYDRKLAESGSSADLGISSDTAAVKKRKKVTRFNLDLEVPSVEDAMSQTKSIAKKNNGYVKSSSFNRRGEDSGHLEAAIPENNTQKFIEEIESRWKLNSKRKNVEDITRRYTELKLELRNKKKELERLEDLMNQTDKVDSLIEIQERMSRLGSRIQYIENKLKQMNQSVEYTTVSIDYEEPQPITAEFELRESLSKSYKGIFQSLNVLIIGLGYLLPFLLFGLLFYKGKNLVRAVKERI